MTSEKSFMKILKNMQFKYLRISVTPDCNASCKFCHNEGQKIGERGCPARRRKSLLTINQYKYIAHFFKNDFNSVLFTGGEPTLVTNLPEIIKVFKNCDYKIRMTTNAFILDTSLQKQLLDAGLDKINVSLPTLNAEIYDKMFNVKGKLPQVLQNIKNLSINFKNNLKINFMALEDETMFPHLSVLSKLSAELNIPISVITTLNNKKGTISKVFTYLTQQLGNPKIEIKNSKFGDKQICHFPDNSIWEFDDFRNQFYRSLAFANEYCQSCPLSEKCVEGPYALRISYDGTIRPCILRNDNIIPLVSNKYILREQ